MAKRKRLTVAPLAEPEATNAMRDAPARAPIADVSRDAATQAAFDEVRAELASARSGGRMVVAIPLHAVTVDHLVRDRQCVDQDEMDSLTDSLRARGQQTPVEVQDLGDGHFGLISGWRRLIALRMLSAEAEDDRFDHVLALIRNHESVPEAYVAMVEENEMRSDLSFYERARIAVEAARLDVYDSPATAVRALFASARRAKRSKILSFTILVDHLDKDLAFPAAIPEKLGLRLSAALSSTPGLAKELRVRLRAAPRETAQDERVVLEAILRLQNGGAQQVDETANLETMAPGLTVKISRRGVIVSGNAVDETLISDLKHWLRTRQIQS